MAGWFDKKFIYEESFQNALLIRYPGQIPAQSQCDEMACNVDFAPTFLDYAGLPSTSAMQGHSLRPLFEQKVPDDWQEVAYHRYWMHRDPDHNAFTWHSHKEFKLIYWYNDGFDIEGTMTGDEPPEWGYLT